MPLNNSSYFNGSSGRYSNQTGDTNMQYGETCVLCELTGCGHAVVDEVNAYILENMGKVHLNEMAVQVSQALSALPGRCFSKEQFLNHMKYHVRHQKVVLSTLLNDLLEVAYVSKDACITICAETNKKVVDQKMLQAYLKTVDSIMAIYRTDALRERRD
tara:strand:- start:16009 stop:16485 length:477 start_codon:yes stop_codon:yes gene_type:complete